MCQILSQATADKPSLSPLQALTAAAICLPGLLLPAAYAAEEETSFTYGHYQEGHRDLYGASSNFNPIEVDSLLGSTQFKLTDRLKFGFNYEQDTWSGATPVASMPLAFGSNGGFTGSNQVLSGATPLLVHTNALFDQNLNPVEGIIDANGNETYKTNTQLVDTLSMASPETRQQGDFKLGYEWDNSALDVGGGVSVEDDYVSGFGNINGRWDFNQKLTTLAVGLSYTHSNTYAVNDHDTSAYIIRDEAYDSIIISDDDTIGNPNIATGTRQDWSTSFGITQILNKDALLEASAGYTRSTGYMENPYKAVTVAFVDPLSQDQCPQSDLGLLCANIQALLEQRPDTRNQGTGNFRYVQYINAVDASVHLGYRIFSDDWGITSHTFEADWAQPLGQGWTLTPRVRYYSQSAANFYSPYLVTSQAQFSNAVDASGREIYVDDNNPGNGKEYFIDPNTGGYVDAQGNNVTDAVDNGDLSLSNKTVPFDRSKLPAHYSSDYRLAGYGAISGGVTLGKQFAHGVALDLGFEYYSHQGSLQLGGNSADNFNNFDAWSATATLSVDLAALSAPSASGHSHHGHHHHGAHAPAGVMFDHILPKAGDMMVGYRFMYGSQGGDLLHGSQTVGNQAIVEGGCGPNPCFLAPNTMSMNMHMLDLMYAPTDWLTLMLMPQFMTMSMTMDRLRSADYDELANNNVGNPLGADGLPTPIANHIPHHLQNGHETGGIGDLGMYALVKLFANDTHHIYLATGFSAPTGDVNIELRRNHQVDGGYIHYGMQLGSGTWDFKPSLTYTGQAAQFSWGAQANGTVRMQDQNPSGYALGDVFQATAWGSYNLTSWLTASLRGVYTLQGTVKGQFDGLIEQFGPMDYAFNYGGRYWDIGFGLSAMVPSGDLAGNRLSVEWLQPVEDYVNGYQLERNGALTATWGLAF
ncbi:MAG: DUF3570 domain-containing protein [Methylococcales bacterium]|nr:DUF3570 domain-containing protein [Methylococcales bacterium]